LVGSCAFEQQDTEEETFNIQRSNTQRSTSGEI